jgi:gluconate 2-dehydrogenase gamma chain
MIDRRELFKILGAATVIARREGIAQHLHGASAMPSSFANYKPRFFNEQQYRVIDTLAEIIIPADDQSPGAHTAGVPVYVDTLLLYSDPETKGRWQSGLASINEAARAQFDVPFLECSPQQQEQLIATLAREETAPTKEAEHFFVAMKHTTIEGFALSDVGMQQHFGYRGNTSVQEFPGCTHPEHQNFSG